MITRLLLIISFVILLGGVLRPSIVEKRLDQQVRGTLLTLQEALQKYHVDEELYPKQTPMTGAELIVLLKTSGYLETTPRNPWSGDVYSPEPDPHDRIRYRTDELAETYSLEALRIDSDTIHHVIDSTEHPSLE